MCGIVGIVDLSQSKSRVNIEILKKMSNVISHRGPDSEGQWISADNTCGQAFRRLSIIDLTDAGSQPIQTLDNRFSITFNGEIYNHKDIRKDLEKRGYQYRSNADTETILYGYQEYGTEILQKMIGMWGVAIWDNQEKRLFLTRDRVGIKPVYYYYQNNLFIYASEIKSILEHPDVRSEMNLDELPNYLNYGMSSQNESLFKNIKKLPAGHYLQLDIHGNVEIHRYWSPINKENQYTELKGVEIQERVMELLRDSIDIRMMSDVPFGVFLSGGIDSSLNVALMAEIMDRPIDTFTVGFKELEEFNELKYARQISKQFNTNHHEILIDSNDVMGIIHDLPWYEDEPNADPVCMPLYFLSKLTKESGTTVIQVGEGSDEQFVGYKWMMQGYNFYNTYWKYFKTLPKFLQHFIYYMAKPVGQISQQYLALDYLRRATQGDELNWSGVSIFSPSHLEVMLNQKYKELKDIPRIYGNSLHQQALKQNPNLDYLQRILYIELQQRLAEILLMRVDKIGMAHSLEARVPFLDHRILEFTMSIPEKEKVPNSEPKYILKKAVEGILPNDIIYRKKMGFAAPVDNWMKNQWYDYAKDRLNNSEFIRLGILNQNFVNGMLMRHKHGKKRYGSELYSLINLTLWYDRFF